jgi:RimJ/RimL family protein N-acetyltransferase
MTERPTLETERLLLRPFTLADAPAVQRLAGDRDIASTTLSIAHPYEDGMAERWISGLPDKWARGTQLHFALERRADGALLGDVLLYPTFAHRRAELGYWLGKPYWGHGYTSEAAAAVLAYAFTVLDLHRVFAEHMTRNPASGRVLQKIGMTYEGTMRHHTLKWGVFEDVAVYGILRDEWDARAAQP